MGHAHIHISIYILYSSTYNYLTQWFWSKICVLCVVVWVKFPITNIIELPYSLSSIYNNIYIDYNKVNMTKKNQFTIND